MAKPKDPQTIDVPSTAVAHPAAPEPTHHALVAANPLDMPVALFQEGIDRRRDNRAALMRTIKQLLVEGTDFGRIHTLKKDKCKYFGPPKCTYELEPYHWSKHCLFKPGAEKICGFLGVTVIYPNFADYENAALEGKEIKQIILRCHIISSSGQVLADGIGARNVEKDYGDLNKALKMASKSAHIDATLRMAGLSEVFTQDLDVMYPDGKPGATASPEQVSAGDTLSLEQVARIEKAITEQFNDARPLVAKICAAYNVKSLAEIPAKAEAEVLERIAAVKKAAAAKKAKK